jgi:FixJ family two-component response regulator
VRPPHGAEKRYQPRKKAASALPIRRQGALLFCEICDGAANLRSGCILIDVQHGPELHARLLGLHIAVPTIVVGAQGDIWRLRGALGILSRRFPGHELLTPRGRVALAHIVRGASSKEIGRDLDISPRTVEFHRKNIMRKLGAKNIIGLVQMVLDEV